MERWGLTKLEFLLIWGVPVAVIGVPVGTIAWLLNWITGGTIQQIVTTLAIVIITVFGTAHGIWILLWSDVR